MTEPVEPHEQVRRRRNDHQGWVVVGTLVALLVLGSFVLVTGQTGFPGPGPLRRYPTLELQALADRLNHLRCEGGTSWAEPDASVDWLRSRVRLGHPESVIPSAHDRAMLEGVGPIPGPVPPESVRFCPRPAIG